MRIERNMMEKFWPGAIIAGTMLIYSYSAIAAPLPNGGPQNPPIARIQAEIAAVNIAKIKAIQAPPSAPVIPATDQEQHSNSEEPE